MTILIIDDHPLLRAGLARLFAIEFGAEVAEAADAVEGLHKFRMARPEITVLDLNLPGESGLSLLQTVRADDRGARIIVLSMRGDVFSARAALRLGALGYLSKSAPPELILEAVRLARGGQSFVEPSIAEALAEADRGEDAGPLDGLSAQELDLLRLLIEGQRSEQIARALGITEKTVANRKSMLRSKLGAANDIELVKSAQAAGFLAV